MNNLKKILLLAVALMLIVAMTSCSMLEQFGIELPFLSGEDDDEKDGDKVDGDLPEKDGELVLIQNSKALFNVVYTQKSGGPGKRAADGFVKDLRSLL